jgi:hypothetical protein
MTPATLGRTLLAAMVIAAQCLALPLAAAGSLLAACPVHVAAAAVPPADAHAHHGHASPNGQATAPEQSPNDPAEASHAYAIGFACCIGHLGPLDPGQWLIHPAWSAVSARALTLPLIAAELESADPPPRSLL